MKHLLILLLLSLLFSCNNTSNVDYDDYGIITDSDLIISDFIINQVNNSKKIFIDIPSPLEASAVIKYRHISYSGFNQTIDISSSNKDSLAIILGAIYTHLACKILFLDTTEFNYLLTAYNDISILSRDSLICLDPKILNSQTINNENQRDTIIDYLSQSFMDYSSLYNRKSYAILYWSNT